MRDCDLWKGFRQAERLSGTWPCFGSVESEAGRSTASVGLLS